MKDSLKRGLTIFVIVFIGLVVFHILWPLVT